MMNYWIFHFCLTRAFASAPASFAMGLAEEFYFGILEAEN